VQIDINRISQRLGAPPSGCEGGGLDHLTHINLNPDPRRFFFLISVFFLCVLRELCGESPSFDFQLSTVDLLSPNL